MTWKKHNKPSGLVQEEAGIHVGIAPNLEEAARHAASLFKDSYQQWLEQGRFTDWGRYKRQHFTVAVGGGNTIKAEYSAWLEHSADIDWLKHVRFFLLDESSGESGWESAENGLVMDFIVPLARTMIKTEGLGQIARRLKLHHRIDENDIIDHLIMTMINPINLGESAAALAANKKAVATKLAQAEALRYQTEIQNKLGATMNFHFVASGIGKDGTLGAFAPYTAELQNREPGAVVLKQASGALRVALNRGVLINADRISLIVSGNLKLKALGRFEMEESADFEQTVMETPLRMLRESREVAEKVYLFADEQALHFDETVFEYKEGGNTLQNKAETREGEEDDGIHILLMHGFMGLFSFTSFLIRLPGAWTVSALHRGSRAKKLSNDEIFPHYAHGLREAILHNWRQGRPAPIAGHSIAGVISDHLLLSILENYEADIPPYEELDAADRELVDALRASGIIHLATWAPTDGPHTGANIKNLVSHYRNDTDLDYSGVEQTYDRVPGNGLLPSDEDTLAASNKLTGLDRFLRRRAAEPLISGFNQLMRYWLNQKSVQQKLLNTNSPYTLRIVGGRLLKKVSFYGLFKEVNAALHDPVEYQRRHLQALEVLLAYDIPFLSIVHEDDFLVSASRHQEEHKYLLRERLKKEKVKREADLTVPARYIMLRREQEELAADPLNPHLLIMATSSEGNSMARQITAAMTQFVNENVQRAIDAGQVKPLPSVRKWAAKNRTPRRKRKAG